MTSTQLGYVNRVPLTGRGTGTGCIACVLNANPAKEASGISKVKRSPINHSGLKVSGCRLCIYEPVYLGIV